VVYVIRRTRSRLIEMCVDGPWKAAVEINRSLLWKETRVGNIHFLECLALSQYIHSSWRLASGRIPDTQVNVHVKHGRRAKNRGEGCFMDSVTSWCTFSQNLNLISEREREREICFFLPFTTKFKTHSSLCAPMHQRCLHKWNMNHTVYTT